MSATQVSNLQQYFGRKGRACGEFELEEIQSDNLIQGSYGKKFQGTRHFSKESTFKKLGIKEHGPPGMGGSYPGGDSLIKYTGMISIRV